MWNVKCQTFFIQMSTGKVASVDERSKVYARGAQAIRMHRMRMYACALKIASEQRATDFKPGISWPVAQWVFRNVKIPFAPEHASSFRRTAPWGARSFPNLPASGGGGKRTLCASCKLATTHAPVAPDAR